MAVNVVATLCFLTSSLVLIEGKAVQTLDMSRTYDNQSLYWPHGQQNYFTHEVRVDTSFDNVDWLQRGTFSTGEHGGTHIDAPIHFARGKWTLDEIPLDRLMALPAVVLDVRAGVEQNGNYLASAADAQSWEAKHGRIPDGAVVLLCTGWESRWPNMTDVYGDANGDTSKFHYPGFGGDLSKWLVDERDVYGVGTDGPSVDGAASLSTLGAHQTLFEHNIWGLEQLLGTCRLPPKGATITSLPIKIGGGSGGPVRAVATWGQAEECATGSGVPLENHRKTCILMAVMFYVITRVINQ